MRYARLVSRMKEISVDENSPVVLLLRHALSRPIRKIEEINTAILSAEEIEKAHGLGEEFKAQIRAVYTSNFPACKDTAEAIIGCMNSNFIAEEANWIDIDIDVFVKNMEQAMSVWNKNGHEWVANELYKGNPVPGFVSSPDKVAESLISNLISHAEKNGGGTSIFVCNGAIILWILALLFKKLIPKEDYPQSLDGMLIYRKNKQLVAFYRDHKMGCCLS